MARFKVVCCQCGSEDVRRDAAVKWNIATQAWEIVKVHENGTFCNNCRAEDGETEKVEADEFENPRPLFGKSITELLAMAEGAMDAATRAALAHELTFRHTPKAKRLLAKITEKEAA